MDAVNNASVARHTLEIPSVHLNRAVTVDLYLPSVPAGTEVMLLLINDGQDLLKMQFLEMLDQASQTCQTQILCAGIHAGSLRRYEYGTAHAADYLGRGNLAKAYAAFVVGELMPAVRVVCHDLSITHNAFAGFSLGGLSALDIVWNHPNLFDCVGVFSGSLWWRSLDTADAAYDDGRHRILHHYIADSRTMPAIRFFFECGTLDEEADRNRNGVIDSIDDTLDMIDTLVKKGYDPVRDIRYLEIEGGRHDVATWEEALPPFLEWCTAIA